MIIAEGRRLEDVSRAEFQERPERLRQELSFLAKLGDIALRKPTNARRRKLLAQVPKEWSRTDLREHLSRDSPAPSKFWKQGRGQPRNLAAYLVLQDAAAIFEWLTDLKAARGVDDNLLVRR